MSNIHELSQKEVGTVSGQGDTDTTAAIEAGAGFARRLPRTFTSGIIIGAIGGYLFIPRIVAMIFIAAKRIVEVTTEEE